MGISARFFLGSVSGIATVAIASAGSPMSPKADELEYVRVCSEHGKGFFYIPGSDTCIQIGGRVRADAGYWQTNDRNNDSVNFGSLARLSFDVRNNTPWGTARAYLRYSMQWGGNGWNRDFSQNGSGSTSRGADIDRAYIQWVGLTAGRTTSMFDFYDNSYNFTSIRASYLTQNMLAYTVTFGSGWSATLSLEDGARRRNNYSGYNGSSRVLGSFDSSGNFVGNRTGYVVAGSSADSSMPDVVSNINVIQSWGQARLAAALHQVRPAYGFQTGTYGSTTSTPAKFTSDTDYGFAVSGAVKFNLPMLAPGDELWMVATYAQGATSYLGAPGFLAQGSIYLPVVDAFVDGTGKTKLSRGYAIIADLMHYWTSSLRSNLFASFMQINYGNRGYDNWQVTNANGSSLCFNNGFVDVNELKIGTNLIFSPIKNLDLGVEVVYSRLDPKGRVLEYNPNNGNYGRKTISSDDSWQGRIRVQRDF